MIGIGWLLWWWSFWLAAGGIALTIEARPSAQVIDLQRERARRRSLSSCACARLPGER